MKFVSTTDPGAFHPIFIELVGNLYLLPLYSMFRDAEKQAFQENGEHGFSVIRRAARRSQR
jgi:hypothetical protein